MTTYKVQVTREYGRWNRPKTEKVSVYICYSERDADALMKMVQGWHSSKQTFWDSIDGEPWTVIKYELLQED